MSDATNPQAACPICGGQAGILIKKERNVSCGDYFEARRLYPQDLGEIDLRECTFCGFAWFPDMHHWSEQQFSEEIYNSGYDLCDPPFREERPRKLSDWLSKIAAGRSLLDFGGGEGRLSELLRVGGVAAQSYDPFYGDETFPTGQYDIVTAFEVVEHVPDQANLFRTLRSFCKPDGVIIFSTLLKPRQLRGDWWYASPRNGHVSIHSADSLSALMHEAQLGFISLSDELHIAAIDPDQLNQFSNMPPICINGDPEFRFQEMWTTFARIKNA